MEEKLESLEETVEVLADKKLLGSIKKSLDEVEHGQYKGFPSVKEFRTKFEAHPDRAPQISRQHVG